MRALLSCLVVMLMLQSSVVAAELPVKKVILYKHGIGYFERGGEIPAGESARLDFKSDAMNDVLKSLTIFDATGNSVSGVRYDSSQPLAEKLKEFPFALGERSPLADFFDQVKGATIELQVGAQRQRGKIVGARAGSSREKAQTSTEFLSLLLDTGEIGTVDLAGVTSMRLVEPELQRQLNDYLRSLNASRSREQKSVYIDSTRDAARTLNVAYTIPMPVWKSSYRLVLDAGAQKKPLLEGWAIIDNTTSEDWSKVELSVISGKPISFVSKLYEPKIAERVEAELEEEAPVGPPVYKSAKALVPGSGQGMGVGRGSGGGFGAGSGGNMGGGAYSVGGALAAPAPPMAEFRRVDATSTVSVETATREAGELFEYKFSQPVTVKRNESAMLPFVQQAIDARKLLIYTQGSSRENPMNSAELTNTTGKTLDGGPLSVYDGGVYAGEALVNTLKAKEKRLISYAVDLGTRVTEETAVGDGVVRKISASRGVATRRTAIESTRTYDVSNVDGKAKTLVIEHAIRPGYTLLNVKPTEKTATHYRFEIKLTGEAAQKLEVKEENVVAEEVLIRDASDTAMLTLIQSSLIAPAAKQALNDIREARRAVFDSSAQERSLQQQANELSSDQERIRKNLASLNGVTGQQERVQKYATDLANLDSQITSLKAQAQAEARKREGLQKQLATKIEALNF